MDLLIHVEKILRRRKKIMKEQNKKLFGEILILLGIKQNILIDLRVSNLFLCFKLFLFLRCGCEKGAGARERRTLVAQQKQPNHIFSTFTKKYKRTSGTY